jgi:DNA-binding NarL/FixJ family response regulator
LNCDEAIQMIAEESPDLIILDIELNDTRDGIELGEFVNKHHEIPIVILTANSDLRTIERAKPIRPAAFLVKPFKKEDLHSAVEIALSNHQGSKAKLDFQSVVFVERVKKDFEITEREIEIITLVSKGRKQKDIGSLLDISEATVKRHLSNIFLKLGVNSSIEMLNKLMKE